MKHQPDLGPNPGRTAFVDAIAGKVLATAILIGTYLRGEPVRAAAVSSTAVPTGGLATG